ncbi:unnamed protein product [Ceutorhynchus assimilis]|uniref:Uncharacterized protein n=1 Tax=Ceutorhynchus assimilis TaxID=467358 RepID=A0A9N9MUN1_9CUCU|nr:unnamed protein product [Ceutorhynchus assimilis]
MNILIFLAAFGVCVLARPERETAPKNYIPNEYEKQQNMAARYKYSSNIDDHISDLTHQHEEEREGLAVKGMYSYSDGFYKRNVQYVADENGYRVIGESAVPLDGPHIDLSGTASVQSAAHGSRLAYKQNNALQDNIEYIRLFEHRSLEPQQVATPKDDLQGDPAELRELFKEFLLQYKKNSEGQKTEEKPSTTTTTQVPVLPVLNLEQESEPSTTTTTQASMPIFPVVNLKQESVNVQPTQKRRLTLKRKTAKPDTNRNNLASSKPVSTSLSHITEPAPRIERQKQTTTSTLIVVEEERREILHHNTAPQIVFKPAPVISQEIDEVESRKQAEDAKYQFASAVDDGISGNLLQREEVRDGLAVRGKYSFSDGYFKRTVHYEADDRGYRVIKEEVDTLDGPHTNPNGRAKVSSYLDGNSANYEITKDDIRKKDEKLTFSTVFDKN